ncbi:endonuclease-reverse transcriptase domain-containing protein [Hirsutella rhossiliensis]|uniref:Endonuclease-reverse transcriptase domain-containing protein n=1 Tax=Hirsutella rhossiliensis TaxID=111463 RepID=A0A9P8MYH8_9HYPO|nr:endonuclease-reverse transcriptase domain-containing protein [Hirsutella rhossiliensis]KAH0962621.1 endonuclease-reverse transcriptase domain-containing protein [Hirsutella rhossiliensis]
MTVFRAFCESFEQTAKHFTSGLEHSFAEQFSSSFLDFWRQALSDLNPAPAPTYSSVAAGHPASQPLGGHTPTAAEAPQQQRPRQPISRLQGRPSPAPPKEDLRVFVRLDAEAPARDHSSYAIRTHIAAKVGIDLHRVPAAFKVNSGWAIRTLDATIRDLIVQRQSEWSEDLTRPRWRLLTNGTINYEAAVKDEIACQTGLTPISIRPSLHDSNDLPNFSKCPARPKRSHGVIRRLTKEEKTLVRQMGAQLFAQRKQHSQNCSVRRPGSRAPRRQVTGQKRNLGLKLDQDHVSAIHYGNHDSSASERGQRTQTSFPFKEATHQPHCTISMTRYPRVNQSDKKTLRVFQANVGKISPAHDCALALADSERYDIVLLQEPWTEAKDGRCLTKTHPAYDTFSPVDSWDDNSTRPRVMTYVRRRPCLMTDQRRPVATRDILWLTINNITVVNFYRQPYYDEALDILLQWTTPGRCLVAGDFNAKHSSWQAGRLDGRGDDIAYWASENGLSLLNPADVLTNPHGNTIDLAFSNIPLSEAVVEEHLATSSDHFTLSVTLADLAPASVPLGKVRLTSDDELARFAEMVDSGAIAIPAAASSPQELDSLALALADLLQLAAKAAGRPVRKGARSAPWWTEECALAAAEYRAIRRVYPLGFNQEVQSAKRDFQKVARRAKRLYWRNLIDSFTDSASVFKAVRWLRSPGAFQPPPLQVGDIVYETQLDKANALRRATLERRTADDDIPDPWIPVDTMKTIPFTQHVSFDEVRDATLRTGNTSPGPDSITVQMLKVVWHVIGSHVHRLYEGCLTIGHHPKPFREAEVVMITKPRRRNLSTPRAWRPISLLSCLGKGLERLIARRLAWASIHYGVLHSQQTGALPKRSAVDLVAALLHDIEEAFARGQVATLVTMDIQGAFDTVLRNRLILRLRKPKGRFGYADDTGIWLDSTLSFKTHVEKWTAKAQVVAYHLKGLANTKHGPLPGAVRRAVRACIEPVLLHGAEAWYPGLTSPRWIQPAKEGPSGIQQLIRKMNKSLHTSIRAVLPVWRTTPINALHRESGIPPAIQLLEARRMRFSARLKSLDEAHPSIKLKYQMPREGFRTRLRRSDQLLHCSRRPILLPRRFGDDQALPLQTATKDQSAAEFCSWLRGMPADSSQDVFLEFQALATAHAKAGTSQPEPAGAIPTLAYLRRAARQQPKSAFKAWWEASAPEQYKPLHLKPTTGCPLELKLPRPLLHHLLAARTRHGDFADYHERFNHDDARLTSQSRKGRDFDRFNTERLRADEMLDGDLSGLTAAGRKMHIHTYIHTADADDDFFSQAFFSLNISLYNKPIVASEWQEQYFLMHGRVHPYVLAWDLDPTLGEDRLRAVDYCAPALIIRDLGFQASV